MSPLARFLIALVGAGGLAQASQAQPYYPQTLPAVLAMKAQNQVQAMRNGGSPGATAGAVVSFTAGGFAFAATPPLRFERIGSYAYYIARCAAGPAQTGAALPPRPPLAQDTSLTMSVRETIPGLSFFSPPTRPPPDALTGAWAAAATNGRATLTTSPTVLTSGKPPPLDPGYIVLTVTPFYALKDAAYQVSANLGAFVVNDPAKGERLAMGSGADPVAVIGELAGGKWAQGSGILLIRAPGAVPATSCSNGAFVTPLTAAQLASFGLADGKPIVPTGDMTYLMDRGGAP